MTLGVCSCADDWQRSKPKTTRARTEKRSILREKCGMARLDYNVSECSEPERQVQGSYTIVSGETAHEARDEISGRARDLRDTRRGQKNCPRGGRTASRRLRDHCHPRRRIFLLVGREARKQQRVPAYDQDDRGKSGGPAEGCRRPAFLRYAGVHRAADRGGLGSLPEMVGRKRRRKVGRKSSDENRPSAPLL